jgi:hypothetical protein
LAVEGHQIEKPEDLIKDPFVLEFLNIPDTNGAEKTFGVAFIPMVFVDVDQMDGVILTLHVYRGKLTNSIRFHYANGQTIKYDLTID